MAPDRSQWHCLGDFSQDRLFVGKNPMRSIYSASMQDDIQRQILGAFLVVLKPIARILLRFGIGFREFSEIAKTAFVDVASSDFGLRGRPTNISRVAVMTGLTRKEVRRLRDKITEGKHTVVVKPTPLWDILHYWHADREFIDESGRPATLPFTGESGSFASLVKRFGGDIPPGAMRTELKRVGAIEEDSNGRLSVLKRTFRPEGNHESLVASLVQGVYPMLATVSHNTDSNREGDTWTQRIAYTQAVRRTDVPRLKRITADRIGAFAESIDDVFMAYETLHENDDNGSERSTLAVGVFYFEDREQGKTYIW